MADQYRFEQLLRPCLDKVCNWYDYENNSKMSEMLHQAAASLDFAVAVESYYGDDVIFHNLKLAIPESLYFEHHARLTDIANQIRNRVNDVAKAEAGHESIQSVIFSPFGRPVGNTLLDPPTTALKRIWKDDCPLRVFLSHRDADKKLAGMLSARLHQFGVSAFVAHKDIQVDQVWQEEIENALISMHAFVALVTDDFHSNSWTDQEVGFALGRGVKRIAVKLGKSPPKGFINKFQAMSSGWDGLAEKLFPMFIDIPQWKDSYITAVRKCATFDDGMMLAKMMPIIDSFSPKQIQELLKAANANPRIYNCYGFNGSCSKVKSLMENLKRWTANDYVYADQRFKRPMPPPPVRDTNVDDDMPF